MCSTKRGPPGGTYASRMTTQPKESSREAATLPVEQLAGHDVGCWVTLHTRAGVTQGYLIALEVNRAVIDDSRLCEATTRYMEHNLYTLTVHGAGQFGLHPGELVHVEEASPTLGQSLARVRDVLKIRQPQCEACSNPATANLQRGCHSELDPNCGWYGK